MNKKVLTIENLHITYHSKDEDVKAVSGVDLCVFENENVALIGESGSGKTALAKAILKLQTPPYCTIDQGRICFLGQDLLPLSEKKMQSIRGSFISMILQDPMTALNPVLKVSTQMTEMLLAHKNISRKQARKKVIEMLHLVDIDQPEKRLDQYPHQLSGGICQRVLIAMSLLNEPQLVIADELTTALDATTKAKLTHMLKKLQAHFQFSMLMISHDLGFVSGICDRIYVMYDGKMCEMGQTDTIFYDPKHPYTKALLDSLPKEMLGGHLKPIKGQANIKNSYACAFCPRCDFSMQICKNKNPFCLEQNEHSTFCHMYDPLAKEQLKKFNKIKDDENAFVTS